MPGPYSVDLRERVVRARLVDGLPIKEVAALFDVGTATVKRWTARLRAGEGLVPLVSPGRPREFTEEHDAHLAELVAAKPDASLGELADGIAERFHRQFDEETVRRGLLRLGLSRKKRSTRLSEILRGYKSSAGSSNAGEEGSSQSGWSSSTRPAVTSRWTGMTTDTS